MTTVVALLLGFGYTFTSGAFDAWLADGVGLHRLAGVYLRGAQVGRIASLAGITGAPPGTGARTPRSRISSRSTTDRSRSVGHG